MRAAETAANIHKKSHQWYFKSIKDNLQSQEQQKAKKGFLICNLLDS